MLSALRSGLLICCMMVPVWMHYAEFPSQHYNVDPSSVVFPSSLSSPFATANRVHLFDESVDLQSRYQHAVDGLFAVTTRLKVLLGLNSRRNLLVSPLSSTTALGQILLGARGPSRRHLLEIMSTVNRTSNTTEATAVEFHQELGGLLKLLQTGTDHGDSYQLHLANALFLHPELRLLSNFQHAITDLYGTDLIPLNFSGDPESVLQTINQWAASHTNGVINKLYSHPLPATTAAVLTNAIYFKGDWETPFNPRHTIAGTFKSNETHAVAVQYMRGQFDLMYVESKRTGCRMVAIPYKHAKAAMYVILPDKGNIYSIQAFAASLSVEDILELISTTKMASVSLVMPKMKLSHVFSLRKVLSHFRKDIGASLRDAVHRHRMTHQNGGSTHSLRCHGWNCTQFNQPPCNSSLHTQSDGSILNVTSNVTAEDEKLSFDMSGASPDYQFRIDDIIQHVYVEVSELGTIAAAVGGTIVDYFGDYTNFVMDRPFLFFIRHEVTGTPLFWGTIVEPTNT